MLSDDNLIDWLTQADEWRQQGRAFRITDLCPDHPEYWSRLEDLWQRMLQLDQQLHVAELSNHEFGQTAMQPSAPLPTALLPAEAFAQRGYEILNEIGRGGMGVVYRARQLGLKRFVALKMILVSRCATPEQMDRFQGEAEILARLPHPNVVQIHEVGDLEGLPFFCMEYLEGGSLAEKVNGQPQPPQAVADLVERLARAVHAAHEQGIVHRDLKPANILLDGAGVPKITDFGLAKHWREEAGQTGSHIVGTPSYLAPEQVRRGGVAIGPATDVYALGVILYELLTGRVPHQGENSMDTVLQVLHEEPVPPSRLQPRLPADLETIALKCLSKQPRRRYASAAELADDLRRCLNREPIRARPTGSFERLARWCQRRPAVATMSAALFLVSVVGFVGVFWQLRSAEAARAVAEQEKETADAQRGRALQLADDLRRQRDVAEWQTYRANIGAAMSAIQLHNVDSVRHYLAAAPEKHRNWEWAYLSGLLDPADTPFRGHEDKVLAVAFNPDGRFIASGSADRTVRLWEVATGREMAVLRGHENPVWQVVFSPDGRRLASSEGPRTVRLWDPAAGTLVALLSDQSVEPNALTFSPDSRFVCVARERDVYLWEATTGKLRQTFRHPTRNGGHLAFAPDSKRLFESTHDGMITAWDVESGQMIRTWQAHASDILALCISPDGQCLASASDFRESAVRLWDAASGRELATLAGHRNAVHYLVFSHNGSRLVSVSWDQTARLWDRATGRSLAIFQHRGHVTHASFRPDDAQLVTRGDDRTLRLWDTQTGEPLTVLSNGSGIAERGTAFSPDGTRLACASYNHQVVVWDVGLLERNGVLRGHRSYVYDVAFSPDGTQVASAAWDGTVRLWDATSQRQINLLKHEEASVQAVAWSSDGKRLVSVARGLRYGSGGTISVWELAQGRLRYRRQVARTVLGETRVAVNRDASLVAVATHGASAEVFELSSGQASRVFGEPQASSVDVAFSTDGRELATAERDGTVRLWNVATGSPVGVLRGHQEPVSCIRYSPDGEQIASAGMDHTVRLWDAKTRTEVALFSHGSGVFGLAFSPDCSRLATACQDNTIRLWDLGTHDEVMELPGHTDYVHAVAFSPDGTRLASCSGDYTVRVWDTLSAAARARRIGPQSGRIGEGNARSQTSENLPGVLGVTMPFP
jgi:WD40 repeat protein/predicted Ser/Thr protein kinase